MTANLWIGVGCRNIIRDISKVNVTNYTHPYARDRAHSNITYGVGIYLYNSEVKNILKIIMCAYKLFISFQCNNYLFFYWVILIILNKTFDYI